MLLNLLKINLNGLLRDFIVGKIRNNKKIIRNRKVLLLMIDY